MDQSFLLLGLRVYLGLREVEEVVEAIRKSLHLHCYLLQTFDVLDLDLLALLHLLGVSHAVLEFFQIYFDFLQALGEFSRDTLILEALLMDINFIFEFCKFLVEFTHIREFLHLFKLFTQFNHFSALVHKFRLQFCLVHS